MTESKASPYEVRCARCDVSFPVEAKTCMHCGGPTGKPGRFASASEGVFSTGPNNDNNFGTGVLIGQSQPHADPARAPFEPSEGSPFSHGDAFDEEVYADARASGQLGGGIGVSDSASEEEETSVGRSLMNSLGGVIWVVLLVGFSLARSCGD